MERSHTSIAALPDEPGVYLFVGARKRILYVGKATSLRNRVRSYFAGDLVETRGAHMVRMVHDAQRVEYRSTDSVLEALILEANLIKTFKPPFNTRDKDDKSFNYLVITTDETYPRLLTVRGKDLVHVLSDGTGTPRTVPVYGPFPHATEFKEALKLIRKIFPYYDTVRPVDELMAAGDRKLRFNQSIGVYPAAQAGRAAYARTIRHIRTFFEGKKAHVLRALERDMRAHAKARRFEEAAVCKRQLFALRHINDVSLIRRTERAGHAHNGMRIEGYDVAHMAGAHMTGVMTVVEAGAVRKDAYRTFNVRSVAKSNDTAALSEVLTRRLRHPEWSYPNLIVVDGGSAQLAAARTVLAAHGVDVPVVAVTKDERHRPKLIQGALRWRKEYEREILLVNAEAHRFSITHFRNRARRGQLESGKQRAPHTSST